MTADARRRVVDKVAAAVMLQAWLDQRASRRSRETGDGMTDTHKDWTTEEDADAGWVSDVDEEMGPSGMATSSTSARPAGLAYKVIVAILFSRRSRRDRRRGRPLALGRSPDQPTRRSGCQAHRDDRPGRDDFGDRGPAQTRGVITNATVFRWYVSYKKAGPFSPGYYRAARALVHG